MLNPKISYPILAIVILVIFGGVGYYASKSQTEQSGTPTASSPNQTTSSSISETSQSSAIKSKPAYPATTSQGAPSNQNQQPKQGWKTQIVCLRKLKEPATYYKFTIYIKDPWRAGWESCNLDALTSSLSIGETIPDSRYTQTAGITEKFDERIFIYVDDSKNDERTMSKILDTPDNQEYIDISSNVSAQEEWDYAVNSISKLEILKKN